MPAPKDAKVWKSPAWVLLEETPNQMAAICRKGEMGESGYNL